MEKFEVITGKDLTIDLYQKTWELDNVVFDENCKISEELSKMFYKNSSGSPILLWNKEDDCLVGYLSPFLMQKEFFEEFVYGSKTYKTIEEKDFYNLRKKSGNATIYIFSTVIKEEYQDVVLTKNKESKFYNKTAFKVLNEAMVDWLSSQQEKVNIEYVTAEYVSEHGKKYLESLDMKPCGEAASHKYYAVYDADCFKKSSNYKKLKNTSK